MKRFSFSLQAVYDFKISQRDEAERQLGAATSSVVAAQAKLGQLKQQQLTAIEAYRRYLSQESDIRNISLQAVYLESLLKQESTQQERLEILKNVEKAKRQAAIGINCETEVLAQLRNRHYQGHKERLEYLEQQALNEIAILKFNHRKLERR